MAKVALKKYRLTQAQLRSLTIAKWPELDQQGNVVIVSNPTGKPYRFVDGTPGAPVGFGFYVGPMGAFYELRIQHNGVRRRLALGSVQELTLARAHELAGAQRHHIRHTGEDPRERVRTEAARQKARGKTVGEALEDYIAHLEDRLARGRAKAGGVEGVKDALARLQRPEVNLADKAIAALTAKDLLAAWNGLRHTCMLQSNWTGQPFVDTRTP
ncbi:integrase arm-type DNA-binding domain-containing protein [Stenotrophomonas acidaminiphila]|uniref:integrase arm-type DNA-binding domain-containing protein n=1 Tax=Stenotrophomonas acidaminiphila TaxID=128780 RepID=UPI0015F3F696|nr:integrase arm-type DNA-binding domain-containing protein [Stenotrophomonas acidaminiphila]